MLGVICCYADQEGVAFVAVDAILDKLRVNRRTAQRAIALLRAAGYLVTEPRFVDGRQLENRFSVLYDGALPAQFNLDFVGGEGGAGAAGGGGVQTAPGGGVQTAPIRYSDLKTTDKETSVSFFDDFWAAYPNRCAKVRARREFGKVVPTHVTFAELMAGLERAKASQRWHDGYIPNPATWLLQHRWLDELKPYVDPIEEAAAGGKFDAPTF